MKAQIYKHKKSDCCSMTADVYIPHQVMCQKDISNDTKLIFGKIYSEIMNELTPNPIEVIIEIISDECENISLESIWQICMCDYPEAIRIKRELVALSSTNIIEASVLEHIDIKQKNFTMGSKQSSISTDADKIVQELDEMMHSLDDEEQREALASQVRSTIQTFKLLLETSKKKN